jgi:hypothetical protein
MLEVLARLVFFVVGVAIFLHYSAMAGYVNRSPRWLVVPLLAVLVSAGVALVWCGVFGQIDLGTRALAVTAIALFSLYMLAYVAGMHMSEVFEAQARAKDLERSRYYWREARDGYEYVANDIVTDSGLAELKAAQRREKERA